MLLFLLPLAWMVTTSLRPVGLPQPGRFELWPSRVTLANYPAIFTLLPLGRYALNSTLVALASVLLTLWTASWAAFALAQLPPRWRGALLVGLMGALLVPVMALWLPRFLVFRWLGVLDTLLVLVLPALLGGNPVYVLILFWAFRRIPADVFEAARLDGCGALRAWWSVGLPMVRPSLAAVAVLAFVSSWSSFAEPLFYIHNPDNYTLPLGLQALRQLHPSRWPLLMAGATLVTLPVLALFLLAQRAFVQEHLGRDWRRA